MRRRTSTIVMLAAMASLTIGGTVQAQSPDPGSDLAGTTWAVSEIAGTPGSGATLVITDGSVGGSAGCNQYSADYTVDGASVTIGEIGTTRMACEDAVMAFETSFLGALASVTAYAVDGDTLTLSDAGGNAVLVFQREAPATLEGVWLVTGYNDGSAVVSVVEGTEPILTFDPDGTMSGYAGCNQFGGGYSVHGDAVAIGPLMSTAMFCEDPIGSQEAHLMAALQAATTWSVSAGTAELRGPDDALQVTMQRLGISPF